MGLYSDFYYIKPRFSKENDQKSQEIHRAIIQMGVSSLVGGKPINAVCDPSRVVALGQAGSPDRAGGGRIR